MERRHDLLKTLLGLALREARENTPGIGRHCLTQNAIGEHIGGVNSHTIGDYELGRGGVPPDAVVAAYIDLTGVTHDELLESMARHARELTRRRGEPPPDASG